MIELLTVKETAKYMRLSVPYIYKLVEDGKITHARFGCKILFRVEDIDELIRSRIVPSTREWIKQHD